MKEKKSVFFRIYFILMIISSLVRLFDIIFMIGKQSAYTNVGIEYNLVVGTFEYGIMILSIIAIIVFIKRNFSRVSLVLPVYHIGGAIGIFVYQTLFELISIIRGIAIQDMGVPPGLIEIGVLSYLFELIFAIYIVDRYK
jgi:hypothetical protein